LRGGCRRQFSDTATFTKNSIKSISCDLIDLIDLEKISNRFFRNSEKKSKFSQFAEFFLARTRFFGLQVYWKLESPETVWFSGPGQVLGS